MDVRVLPWSCWSEWAEVYANLFDAETGKRHTNSENLHQALAQVELWRARGKLPVAVCATASLMEAEMLDRSRGAGGGDSEAPGTSSSSSARPPISTSAVRSLYASGGAK